MPLPQLTGDPGTLLQDDGQAGLPAEDGQGQSQVNPQEQVRGAVQQIGAMRKQVTQTLESIATQFPTVSKTAKELQQAIDSAMQRIVRELVKTVQQNEPEAPRMMR